MYDLAAHRVLALHPVVGSWKGSKAKSSQSEAGKFSLPEARPYAAQPLFRSRGYCAAESWEPEVSVPPGLRRVEPARKPLQRRYVHAVEAPPEKIAGDQWLQSLEKRMECISNLAPGSFQDALALPRHTVEKAPEVEFQAAAPPGRPTSGARPGSARRPSSAAVPSSAMGSTPVARPTSAMRSRRPQSANLLQDAKTRRANQVQQKQEGLELRVIGAGKPLPPQRRFVAQIQRRDPPIERRQLPVSNNPSIQPVQCRASTLGDEEWKQLGVPDVGIDEPTDDHWRTAMISNFFEVARPTPYHCGPQKLQVSPVESPRSSVNSLMSPQQSLADSPRNSTRRR